MLAPQVPTGGESQIDYDELLKFNTFHPRVRDNLASVCISQSVCPLVIAIYLNVLRVPVYVAVLGFRYPVSGFLHPDALMLRCPPHPTSKTLLIPSRHRPAD